MGYLTNFIVYTCAMVGVLMLALFIFKKSTQGIGAGQTKFLKVLDTMNIGPRKTLYIIAAGSEKFLIAGDTDRTTLISKLNNQTSSQEKISEVVSDLNENFATKSFQQTMTNLAPKKSYADKSNIGIKSSLLNTNKYDSVMKNLAEIMRG